MADPDEDDNYAIIGFDEVDTDEDENSNESSNSSDENAEHAPTVEFDIRLTSTHGYMNAVEAVPGEAIYFEASFVFEAQEN
jgi:hypothetical protein